MTTQLPSKMVERATEAFMWKYWGHDHIDTKATGVDASIIDALTAAGVQKLLEALLMAYRITHPRATGGGNGIRHTVGTSIDQAKIIAAALAEAGFNEKGGGG